jgi:hypothetical protein
MVLEARTGICLINTMLRTSKAMRLDEGVTGSIQGWKVRHGWDVDREPR